LNRNATPRFPRHHWRGSIEAMGGRTSRTYWANCFRAIIGAAPLKLARVRQTRADRGVFPRHHWRGSIEAIMALYKQPTSSVFPRHHWRGSIEACEIFCEIFPDFSFPRHHWRGSIEARRNRSGSAASTSCFRAIIGAAPLKLLRHEHTGKIRMGVSAPSLARLH